MALKALGQRRKEASKTRVGIGAVVTLQVDYRVHCHAPGLLEIVFDFKPESGGVCVCSGNMELSLMMGPKDHTGFPMRSMSCLSQQCVIAVTSKSSGSTQSCLSRDI